MIAGEEVICYREFTSDGYEVSADVSFINEKYKPISSLNGSSSCTAKIIIENTSDTEKNLEAVMIMYGADSTAKDIKMESFNVFDSIEVTLTCPVIGEEGSRACIYVYDRECDISSPVLITPKEIKY